MSSRSFRWLICAAALFGCNTTEAVERYVSAAGGHVSPFTSWASAATNIQAAIEAAGAGDLILVTNGSYSNGGKAKYGDLTNRVAIDKALTVRSVNGPKVTVIQGAWHAGTTNGTSAERGVWMANGAVLDGFTIRDGATRTSGDNYLLQTGGGVWCNSASSLLTNCVIAYNAADYNGGGVYRGTLRNCVIATNSCATAGGATLDSALHNCLIRANRATLGAVTDGYLVNCTVTHNQGGGVRQAALTNCIAYFNQGGNISFVSAESHCCSIPILAGGQGNFSSDPQLLEDGIHLAVTSPCRAAGTNVATGTDLDGQAWSNPPSIGCDDWQPAPVVVSEPTRPQLRMIRSPDEMELNVFYAGAGVVCYWYKDSVLIHDDAKYSSSSTTNLLVRGFGLSDAGNYQVVVSNAFGVATSSVTPLAVRCVDASGTNPIPPFASWSTAATTIQAAVDAASAYDFILVTNGVYSSGGRIAVDDYAVNQTNRVVVDKPVVIVSVNGPTATSIRGNGDGISPTAVRCVWMTNGSALGGFTLEGGATIGPLMYQGGGARCGWDVLLDDCIIRSNTASAYGGGVYGGRVHNSLITGNTAQYGGGAYFTELVNCAVTHNWANYGGGVVGGATNCTIAFNSAYLGGGAYGGTLVNSIVHSNLASGSTNGNYEGGQFFYCCTTPLPTGAGNLAANPEFLPDEIHLAIGSPCRAAGFFGAASGFDIDGNRWLNPPSIGCDEVWETPHLTGSWAANGIFQIQFNAQAGTTNTVEYTTNPAPPTLWSKLTNITATGSVQLFDQPGTNTVRFYRIRLQ